VDPRLAFDQVPEIYDRARHSYPEPLFDDLFSYLGERGEPSVLEVAAGTGKATRPLLALGARVVAVEIGPRMCAFLERTLAREYPGRLEVINSSFEEAAVAPRSHDAVVIATAFEWIDPAVRVRKSHEALRPGGVLAVIGTNQIASDADRGFFERVQPVHRRHQPADDIHDPHLHDEDLVPEEYDELQASGLFTDAQLRRYRWDQTYTAGAYADLMRSYSPTIMMAPAPREALIADLRRVIDEEFGGSVTRPLVITLTLGRRRA
jgi:SAM-dependent methyltransferase